MTQLPLHVAFVDVCLARQYLRALITLLGYTSIQPSTSQVGCHSVSLLDSSCSLLALCYKCKKTQ